MSGKEEEKSREKKSKLHRARLNNEHFGREVARQGGGESGAPG